MSGFTFNGKHSNEFGLHVQSINRQVLPAYSDIYIPVPGRAGNLFFPGDVQDKQIILECSWKSSCATDFRKNARNIAAWLGVEERKDLIFDDEPQKAYKAKLYMPVDVEQAKRVGRVYLYFQCEPYAYSTTTKTASPNAGTAPTPVKITATMTAATDHLQIDLGDQHIRLETALTIGDEIIIDTAQGWVSLNGLDARQYVTYDSDLYLLLPVGCFEITAENADLAIVFRERWL